MPAVLIVEDETPLRRALSVTLQKENFEVYEAANGTEGLQAINDNPHIELILLDLLMPKMGGTEFVYKLENELKKNIPIIVLTNKKESAMQSLIKEVLIKSDYSLEQIVEKVKLHLGM